MSELGVILTHKRAPVGTQQIRFTKGVEQLYYALLFSTGAAYKNHPEVWRSWLDMGFHVAVKVPPKGALEEDKLHVDSISNGKAPEFHGEGGNAETLQKLRELLQGIDSVRATVAGKDEATRAQELVGHNLVATQLVEPLTASLKQAALRPDEIEHYMYMVKRALLALTHEDVTQTRVSLNGARGGNRS